MKSQNTPLEPNKAYDFVDQHTVKRVAFLGEIVEREGNKCYRFYYYLRRSNSIMSLFLMKDCVFCDGESISTMTRKVNDRPYPVDGFLDYAIKNMANVRQKKRIDLVNRLKELGVVKI